jgi:hypothetical protein
MNALNNLTALASLIGAGARTTSNIGRQVARASKRRSNPRRTRSNQSITMTRVTAPASFALTAGESSGSSDITLSSVQTSDLIAMYDQFKINWVDFEVIPRFDPAQSGVTNNTNLFIAAACDPIGQLTTPTFVQVTAFANAKVGVLMAGKNFRYRFRPKPVNALAAGNVAVNQSDWLFLSTPGIAVAHLRLLYDAKSGLTTDTNSYDYVFHINFSVKGSS